jgi:hypothetical protein
MYEQLQINKLVDELRQVSSGFTDVRTGENSQYTVRDAAMSAVAVFFTQTPSFLAHQRDMALRKGQSNAESLFGLDQLPSDNQIRNLLDPVDPRQAEGMYHSAFVEMERTDLLDGFRSFANQLLIVIDGTEYFASQKIQCAQCSHQTLPNGKTRYFHSALTPVIAQPGNEQVLPLEPEFIVPQDGHEKQDCENQAIKRWIERHGEFYAKRRVTLLGDDLYSHEPNCRLIRKYHLHFILVCKPDSHEELYQTVNFLAANQVLGTKVIRRWLGQHAEIDTYRYTNQVPLRAGEDALQVNWVELTTTREDNGAVLYKNAWITDFAIVDTTVEAIVRDGRTRWKVENENNNVLKTKGYHLEHNFGHGSQHLSALLLSLNLLAFLFHTILERVDARYRAIRHKLSVRRTFFTDLDALLRYLLFPSWQAVLDFMYHGLELDTG